MLIQDWRSCCSRPEITQVALEMIQRELKAKRDKRNINSKTSKLKHLNPIGLHLRIRYAKQKGRQSTVDAVPSPSPKEPGSDPTLGLEIVSRAPRSHLTDHRLSTHPHRDSILARGSW